MSGYNISNVALSNYISEIDSTIASSYYIGLTNIPVANMSNLKSMENPAETKYLVSNNDIKNNSRAKNNIYDSSFNTEIIVNTSGYTHFTAYVVAGSGGGGGCGGDAETNGGSNIQANSSQGGTGGTSGYVILTENVPINNQTLYVLVGSAGAGGAAGTDNNSPGGNGSDGASGGTGRESYVKLGSTVICRANAGTGGGGGGGANSGGGNGNTGGNGSPGIGVINTSYTNYGHTSYNASYSPVPPSMNGGTGGTYSQNQNGAAGNSGYVRLYLKKI